jgi:hypothetical protein
VTADCVFTLESFTSDFSSVAIKNNKNGNYLTLCQKCYSSCPNTLCANGLIPNFAMSQFTLITNNDNTVSFLANNGKYLEYINYENLKNSPATIGCFSDCSPLGFFACNSLYISPTTKFTLIDYTQ